MGCGRREEQDHTHFMVRHHLTLPIRIAAHDCVCAISIPASKPESLRRLPVVVEGCCSPQKIVPLSPSGLSALCFPPRWTLLSCSSLCRIVPYLVRYEHRRNAVVVGDTMYGFKAVALACNAFGAGLVWNGRTEGTEVKDRKRQLARDSI